MALGQAFEGNPVVTWSITTLQKTADLLVLFFLPILEWDLKSLKSLITSFYNRVIKVAYQLRNNTLHNASTVGSLHEADVIKNKS